MARLRSLERYLDLKYFEDAYNKATEDDKKVALGLIATENNEGLKDWATAQWSKTRLLGELTVVELRRIGQQLGVANYFNMPKSQLVSEVERCQSLRKSS